MDNDFLTTNQLAKRWSLEPHTLKKWRCNGKGPLYLKLNGSIRYYLEEVEVFEKHKLRSHTSMPEPAPLSLVVINHITDTKLSQRKCPRRTLSKQKRSRK